MMIAIEAGAEDFIDEEEYYTIYTDTEDFLKVKEALEENDIKEFDKSEVTLVPSSTVILEDELMEKSMNLAEALEDIDDVQDVYHNLG